MPGVFVASAEFVEAADRPVDVARVPGDGPRVHAAPDPGPHRRRDASPTPTPPSTRSSPPSPPEPDSVRGDRPDRADPEATGLRSSARRWRRRWPGCARALATWRFSIIRPSTVTTPRPSASASSKAAMTRRGAARSRRPIGAHAVVGRLDLARVDRASCRRSPSPCPGGTRRRSPRRPDVVVDAVEDRPCRPRGRASRRWRGAAAGLARPGRSGARSSLARSLVPITSTPTRGWAAIARTSKIAVGVSIIAQIDVVGGAGGVERGGDLVEVRRPSRPWGSRPPPARPRPAAARSSAPHGVASPLQRIVSSRLP